MSTRRWPKEGRSFFSSVTVFEPDLSSLRPREWVRSNIIAFFFALCHAKRTAEPGGRSEHDSIPARRDRVLFLDTSVAQCMFFFGSASLGPCDDMRAADIVAVPIADYSVTEDRGLGSHWSLLLAVRARGESGPISFHHLDSHGSTNASLATKMQTLLAAFFGEGREGQEENRTRFVPFVESPVAATFPQQQNSWDCGMYVCAAAQALADANGWTEACGLFPKLTPAHCASLRGEIAKTLVEGAQRA